MSLNLCSSHDAIHGARYLYGVAPASPAVWLLGASRLWSLRSFILLGDLADGGNSPSVCTSEGRAITDVDADAITGVSAGS